MGQIEQNLGEALQHIEAAHAALKAVSATLFHDSKAMPPKQWSVATNRVNVVTARLESCVRELKAELPKT